MYQTFYIVNETGIIITEIQKPVKKGVIITCDEEKGDFISVGFKRENKDGPNRNHSGVGRPARHNTFDSSGQDVSRKV